MRHLLILAVCVTMGVYLQAQEPEAAQGDLNATTQAMSHHHHDHMDGHMHMSALRDPQPGDRERAEKVVEAVRPAL